MLDLFQIAIIGIVQAVTEWLPLSSKTMDTIVYTQFFGGETSSVLSVLLYLHFGTMIAAAIYFRKEIFGLAAKLFAERKNVGGLANGKIGFLFSSLALTALVGFPILLAEKFILPNLDGATLYIIMGIGLIVTGFMLTAQHKNRWRSHESSGWKDGILTGALQGLAALPGISRAGATTTALVWRGFDAESAFHLSFLLSIPTVFCTEVVFWLAQGGISAIPFAEGAALSLSSFFFGYLTIGALTQIAHRINVASLAFVFGIIMLLFGLFGLGY